MDRTKLLATECACVVGPGAMRRVPRSCAMEPRLRNGITPAQWDHACTMGSRLHNGTTPAFWASGHFKERNDCFSEKPRSTNCNVGENDRASCAIHAIRAQRAKEHYRNVRKNKHYRLILYEPCIGPWIRSFKHPKISYVEN